MKKLMMVVSVMMMAGFALALANAQDNTPANSAGSANTAANTDTTYAPTNAMNTTDTANTANTNAANTNTNTNPNTEMNNNTGSLNANSPNSMSNTTTVTHVAKNSKSCTDSNGVTFRKGEKGFTKCVKAMKKAGKDQMGGQAGSLDEMDTHNVMPGTSTSTGSDSKTNQ